MLKLFKRKEKVRLCPHTWRITYCQYQDTKKDMVNPPCMAAKEWFESCTCRKENV